MTSIGLSIYGRQRLDTERSTGIIRKHGGYLHKEGMKIQVFDHWNRHHDSTHRAIVVYHDPQYQRSGAMASPGLIGPLGVEEVPNNPGLATGACVGSTKSILWQWQQEYRISIRVLLA